MHALNQVEHRLRLLIWLQTKDGEAQRNRPEPTPVPPYAHEKKATRADISKRAAAWEARQARTRQH